ncbi:MULTISPECIES: M23 family metallopeptidase [Flavobacterium]|uniref:M23 family metallopeptidase n=1 Tax=Flavobacterium keumense TaxID=1306518 RepID=A0ABY8N4R0_9FLAO|nr:MULTISPECIES: M23 family metallopeptidase [Flavobacterium]WGK94522.1 M23 family metallopeptidase [Flavobacterium keumense]
MRFLLFYLLYCSTLMAQNSYPKEYFSPPLDIPMQLSGNFGELRPNHFHAGFDFKTQQKEGLKVYAAAEGYVSRIKISTFGNGKTIYITHPNGYTSVYAHLQKAVGPIQDFITKTHYKEQAFEIEMYLKPGEIPIKKGEWIAISGNTGASEGPHLHFEIRDSKTEYIINPMLFGFDSGFKDTKKPSISGLYVYPLTPKSTVNKSQRPILLNYSLQKDGTFLADKVVANGEIGFGIIADDYDDVSFNKNGVYSVHSFLNGQPRFEYQFDTYSFDDMRYVNALIDYAKYKKTQQRVQKLFMKNKYGLAFIKTDESKGQITPIPNLDEVYRIEVADFFGNKTAITVPIQFDASAAVISAEPKVSNYFIKANKDNIFEKDNASVFFPAGTFYDDFPLNFEVKNKVLYLHDDTVPAHTNFTITMTDSKMSKEQQEKTFIARIEGEKISYNSTFRKDSVFTTKVKTLGKYKLVTDTLAPTVSITKPIEGRWVSQDTIQLQISDSGSGIKTYNGYLNGKWVLFEYDNKTNTITHYFNDDLVLNGANELKVIVTDAMGNSATFETRFFRSLKK